MTTVARKCQRCGLNRQLRFYVSSRGRVCITCQKKSRKTTARKTHLTRTYGMSDEFAKKLLEFQGNVCAVSKEPRKYNLALDHDHSKPDGPESWRGFVTKKVNKLLRDGRDDPELFDALAAYLRNPPAQELLRKIKP